MVRVPFENAAIEISASGAVLLKRFVDQSVRIKYRRQNTDLYHALGFLHRDVPIRRLHHGQTL